MPRLLLIAFCMVVTACSGATTGPEPTVSSTTTTVITSTPTSTIPPTTMATTVAPEPTLPPTSTTDPFASPFTAQGDTVDGPGTFDRSLVRDDVERTYVLHISEDAWGRTGVPLVVDLHGLASSPASQEELSGFRDKAEEEGFVVVQPLAGGVLPTWQAGFVPSPDLTFIRGVIADVAFHVDVGPVFVSGFSNGAGMAHRLACDAPGEIAAIGTVAGAYPDTGPCEGPVPVIAFHGVLDRVAPFEGAGFLLPDITEWVASWADRAGCTSSDVEAVTADVERRVWAGCDAGAVELYVVTDGRHGWPGTSSQSRLFNSTTTISATDLMWEFFVATTE